MFCEKCEKREKHLDEGAAFCPYCGAEQTVASAPVEPAVQPMPVNQPVVSTQPQPMPVNQPVVNTQSQPIPVNQSVPGGYNLNSRQGNMSPESRLKIMAAALVGLQFLMLILWFMPIFHLNLTREVSSIRGLPGFEFGLSDVVNMASSDTSVQGAEYMQIVTVISVALPILSMILMVVYMTKGVLNMKGSKIFGNTWVSAIWFLFWTIGHYADYNSGSLSKATYGVVEGVSPTFAGVLYILSAAGTIVLSIIMSQQLKKTGKAAISYAPQNFPDVNR